MKDWLIPLLICPKTGEELSIKDPIYAEEEIIEGVLFSKSGSEYKIVNGIPRFVPFHYADGFALQWNRHDIIQLDTQNHTHSSERFFGETGFTLDKLKGATVIDGGCGAGRFAEVAAHAGARVIAVDLSEAVEACKRNTHGLNVQVIQASLFELPFKPKSIDHGFSIGVIQHTPDPLLALASVANLIKPGGEFGVSWYKKYWYTFLHQKYILRALIKPFFNDTNLYSFVSWYAPKLLPFSRFLAKFMSSVMVDRILPVANRDSIPGLNDQERLEWAILDTYDWFNPKYDKPQTWKAVRQTMTNLGYECKYSPHERRGLNCIRNKNIVN